MNATDWQAVTWRLAGRDSADIPDYCCALDIAAGNGELITFGDSAKVAIEIGQRRLVSVALSVPQGFFDTGIKICDPAIAPFVLSKRSVALWGEKWLRIYIWFSLPNISPSDADRLLARVDRVWFERILVNP